MCPGIDGLMENVFWYKINLYETVGLVHTDNVCFYKSQIFMNKTSRHTFTYKT